MKLMVAIPTLRNQITAEVVQLLHSLPPHHLEIEVGTAPIDKARNILVQKFLRTDCDYLWFIDDDMIPTLSTLLLLGPTHDITSARTYATTYPRYDMETVGTGCVIIKRKVLEDRRMWLTKEPVLFRIQYEPDGAFAKGEDIDFCERATALGYSIGMIPTAKCGHFKAFDIYEKIESELALESH